MAYIRIRITSGAVVLKQNEDWILDMDLTPISGGKQALLLTRQSSIVGMIAYLCGITTPIKKLKTENPELFQFLVDEVDKSKIYAPKVQGEFSNVTISSFFERKDTHSKASAYVPNPSVNLMEYGFEDADATVRLFQKPLRELYNSDSLGVAHAAIKEGIKKYQTKLADFSLPSLDSFPNTPLKEKIVKYFELIQQEERESESGFSRKMNPELINLIKKTIEMISTDCNLAQEFQNSSAEKFSVFTTSIAQPRHWIHPSKITFVRGGLKHLAHCDFEVVFTRPNEKLLKAIQGGPMIASWAEGGIAEPLIFEDDFFVPQIGWNLVDGIYLHLSEMRRAGLKIKKYPWEKVIPEDVT